MLMFDVAFIIQKFDDEKRPMDWRRERERRDFDVTYFARIFRAIIQIFGEQGARVQNMFALEDWSPGSR